MNVRRIAATILFTTVATAVPAGLAGTAYAAPTAPSENACVNGHWPADAQGRPTSLQPGAAAGLYLWHTDQGWNVFVTHPGNDKAVFTGTIVSSGTISGVGRDTERRDQVKVTRRNKAIAFRFTNYGRLDGLHFRTKCAQSITVNGKVNGQPLTADHVFIGSGAHAPNGVPFSINRVG